MRVGIVTVVRGVATGALLGFLLVGCSSVSATTKSAIQAAATNTGGAVVACPGQVAKDVYMICVDTAGTRRSVAELKAAGSRGFENWRVLQDWTANDPLALTFLASRDEHEILGIGVATDGSHMIYNVSRGRN